MANEDSVLKEVDQELAEDRQWAMFRRYGPAAIGAGAAIVIAVGGWQFWNVSRDASAKQSALEFRSAVDLLGEDTEQGLIALKAIAEEGDGGYVLLAKLQRAGSLARSGEREGAIAAFKAIYQDGGAPKQLRDLARLRAGYLSLDDGRDAVLGHIDNLPNGEGAFSYHANELVALAALKAEDYETALSIFRRLSIDFGAPEGVRTRAEDLAALADAGKAGVNITGETRVEDLLEAVGGVGEHDLDDGHDHDNHDDHEGHAHAEEGESVPEEDTAETAPEIATETDAPASDGEEAAVDETPEAPAEETAEEETEIE